MQKSPESEHLPPPPLLSVRDLRISFSGQECVHGISFDLARGETLGLVGESGSGKSATSLAMMRLLPPSAEVSGSITFSQPDCATEDLLHLPEETMRRHRCQSIAMIFQEPMTALNPVMKVGRQIAEALLAHAPHTSRREVRERVLQAMREVALPDTAMRAHRGRNIAMIFQEPMTALNPVMRVGDQIAEAIRAHHPHLGRPKLRARVLEAMHQVALPDAEKRMRDYPHQFSGGQRQRILIAMAIVNKPRLLIADEPTTALDVTVQAQILTLLRDLRQQHGLAMLFISHDLAVVSQVADHAAVMQHGNIVERGSTAQIFTHPQHPYTRGLLAASPSMTTPRDRPLGKGRD